MLKGEMRMNTITHKTKLEVDPVEWKRIVATIHEAFDKEGMSRLYAERAIDATASIIYDTQSATFTGRKGFNRPAVSHDADWWESIFKKTVNARKAKKILIGCGILLEDESWCAENLNHPDGPWCMSYAIDYRPRSKERIAVWFPSASSIIETALSRLSRMKNEFHWTIGKEILHVDKKQLVEDCRKGLVDAQSLATFVGVLKKYPTLLECEFLGEPMDRRIYTPLAMVNKSMLKYFKNEKGFPCFMQEVVDLHSGFLFSLMMAFVADGKMGVGNFSSLVEDFYDNRNVFLADRGIWYSDPYRDFYHRVVNHIETEDRGTNVFHDCQNEKEKRDKVKAFVMSCVFATEGERKKWRTMRANAFRRMRTNQRVSKAVVARENEARFKLDICSYFEKKHPMFWKLVTEYETVGKTSTCKNGTERTTMHKTPLYWAMTRGEKIIMDYVAGYAKMWNFLDGCTIYRKHDALLAVCRPLPDDWHYRADLNMGFLLKKMAFEMETGTFWR